MGNIDDFLRSNAVSALPLIERLMALLWWHHIHEQTTVEFEVLCTELEGVGYSSINKTRERERLAKDPRTISKDKGKSFRLTVQAVPDLDGKYSTLLEGRPTPKSNTLLALVDFDKTRGYIEKVVLQINVSYDLQLYDCCAVMIRRLLETLIIELYLKLKRDGELLGDDGHYKMFAGLLGHVKRDAQSLGLGRNTPRHLEELKELADKSAHARNWNCSKKIIDDKKHDFQLAAMELKQLIFDN